MHVEVKQSRVGGLGLFAARDLEAGERIRRISIVREITSESPLREDLGERIEHCSYPDGKVVLVGFPDRHVNHSCDPNAYKLYARDGVYVVARRPIQSGEEITFDYTINTSGGGSWSCNCGSARCRGQCVGEFFSLPNEIQIEYLPLLAGWFIRRHEREINELRRDR